MYVSWVFGDKLRIVMSSIMRWRRGEIGLVIGELLSTGCTNVQSSQTGPPATDAIEMAGEPEPQPQTTALSKSNILNRGHRPSPHAPTAERFSATGDYGIFWRYSGLMLAARITFAHFS